MRRPVVALIAAVLALSLAGCGGGGEETPAADTATTDAPAVAPPPVKNLGITDRSNPEDPTVFEKFPTGDFVPKALAEKLEAKQPTLILFVDGSQKVTNEVRSAVDKAMKENSGVVELVLFDIGEYTSVDSSGNAVVDATGIDKDETAAQAATLASQLKVVTLPYIVMTDDQGYLVFRHRGLVDEDFLLMHMERLTD